MNKIWLIFIGMWILISGIVSCIWYYPLGWWWIVEIVPFVGLSYLIGMCGFSGFIMSVVIIRIVYADLFEDKIESEEKFPSEIKKVK